VQKKHPTEEIKEKLKQQENEINVLKELIIKGFEEIKKQPQPVHSDRPSTAHPTGYVADDGEGISANVETTDQGPDLPPAVPDLI